ncbi:DNA polymerase III subunit beta [Streptacidiphilus jiangxiensis]|uniref:Beta sliding clamp n=1 Tax=Streptacidiphilus jiangxiensis TaxID=235985 RepID=A0A1H7S164_STRJI|nr:DNA polymerase III subunit beta [Streptacidiphilus jiangxiensis]SEL65594.1 DNA polymerase-3 subunit beta [Streptacidiphilus jiangxiensis]
MKLRLPREALAEAVSWAAHALPARSTVPALAGLLLTADQDGMSGGTGDGMLAVAGFDYEVSARFRVAAEISEPGAALVPGRLLADLSRALPGGGHDVELATIGADLTLRCGPAQFELPLVPVEDYPRLPALPPVLGSVDGAQFAEAVAQVAVVAGRDESLPFLTGIRLEFTAGAVRLVATDRYRLAVRDIAWEPDAAAPLTEEPVVALVPARSLHEIARSLTKGERITVAAATDDTAANSGLIGFAAGGREATTRLLGADFITYRSIFPSAYAGSVVIERQPLLDAVKRIALVTDRHRPVRLAFAAGRVTVDAGAGGEARGRQTLDASFPAEAEPIMLAANAGYLVDGLSALSADEAELHFTTPTRPAVLTARGSEDYRYLFMPLRHT